MLKQAFLIATVGLFIYLLMTLNRPGRHDPPRSWIPPEAPQAASLKLGLQWIDRPWNGNETVFEEVKSKVDREVASSNDLAHLVATYRRDAELTPSNSVKRYAWAYCRFCSAMRQYARGRFIVSDYTDYVERHEAMWALATGPDPQVYEFTRLRFLYEATEGVRGLDRLGDRLLKRHPKDLEVARVLAEQLTLFNKKEDLDKGLKLAQSLVSANPNDLRLVAMMAYVYLGRYIWMKDSADAEKCIEWDKRYIAIAPKDSPIAAEKKHNIQIYEGLLHHK